jgi:hypothetical protein
MKRTADCDNALTVAMNIGNTHHELSLSNIQQMSEMGFPSLCNNKSLLMLEIYRKNPHV